MDHLQLTPTTVDHLSTLLRRTVAPSPPSLPPGSRTSAALAGAAAAWSDRHRRAESTLRNHVIDIQGFVQHAAAVDRSLF